MFDEAVSGYLYDLGAAFIDPQKRIFWGYLLSAGLIAFLWLRFSRHLDVSQVVRKIFEKNSWWSRSSRADYRVMALNTAIMSVLSPRLLHQAGVAFFVFHGMHQIFGGRPFIATPVPEWGIAIAITICLFVLDDLARYIVHRLLHTIPALWAFHKVHHSATALNPLTVFRTHPLEGVIFVLRGALVQGICIAVFVFFFGDRVHLVTIFGAGALNFAFNALGSNLRHSHISIGFWKPVERILISPAQHQIHHSTAPEHCDRNFGVALAVWDVWFGTHCYSEPGRTLEFGVRGESGVAGQKLKNLYLLPFVESGAALVRAATQFIEKRGVNAYSNDNDYCLQYDVPVQADTVNSAGG